MALVLLHIGEGSVYVNLSRLPEAVSTPRTGNRFATRRNRHHHSWLSTSNLQLWSLANGRLVH